MSPWLHQLLVDHHSIACSRYGCSLRIPQQYWHVAGAAGTRAAHHVCSLKRRQQLAEWGGGASADEQGRFDEVVEDGGVRILIEPAALMHVIGTTMDFVEDRIKCPTSPPPSSPCVAPASRPVSYRLIAWHCLRSAALSRIGV